MWETANGHMVVRVKWFYHPEETQGCPNLKYPVSIKYSFDIKSILAAQIMMEINSHA